MHFELSANCGSTYFITIIEKAAIKVASIVLNESTFFIIFRVKSTQETTSRFVLATWPTSTSMTSQRPGRSGASARTPTARTSCSTAPRVSSISTRSRTLSLLDSSGPQKRWGHFPANKKTTSSFLSKHYLKSKTSLFRSLHFSQ